MFNFDWLCCHVGYRACRRVDEMRDPNSETLVEIVRALRSLNSEAAETFVQKYLGDVVQGID